jgi:hypothetical protein
MPWLSLQSRDSDGVRKGVELLVVGCRDLIARLRRLGTVSTTAGTTRMSGLLGNDSAWPFETE